MYQQPLNKIRQGDIALCEFHQLRGRGGDAPGPGKPELATEDLPYLGAFHDYDIDVPLLSPAEGTVTRRLRVWLGYGMVVHQNCEIEYADVNDSRLLVAPIVSRSNWPEGRWDLIARRELPAYFHLPPLDAQSALEIGLEGEWPEAAVAFASTTALSRGLIRPNRALALAPDRIQSLQESLVRFWTVRGWGSNDALEALVGMTIVDVAATPETVPGPAPLAKVFLRDGDRNEEITVAWGVRRTTRPI
jgi:hypothetical protein